MSQELYSVEQVAERLGLHARTVRAYIRDGRLKAVRIGKSYRIVRGDLEALMGSAAAALTARPRIDVSSIVEIEAIDREAAIRMTNVLMATANSRPAQDEPLRVETLYDEPRERLKIILVGGLSVVTDIQKLIGVWAQGRR